MDRRGVYRGYIFAVLGLLIGWELLSLGLKNPALPDPFSALGTFFEVLPSSLWMHFLVSTYRVFASLVLSALIAVPLGIYLGRDRRLDRYFAPLLYLLYPIPKIALLPVIIVLFGLGDVSKIFTISLILFFQILVTTRDAAKKVHPSSIVSIMSLGARPGDVYRHVVIPACLPDIFTSIRISLGTAISVLFFTESFATFQGLGYYIFEAWSRVDYPEMFAGILGMSLLGLLMFVLVDFLQRLLCPWLYA
ncbi:MAG: ABC transporter permease [Thermacetogeniaceae bacterium]|jgi:NitT/TauT family transport system permease protein